MEPFEINTDAHRVCVCAIGARLGPAEASCAYHVLQVPARWQIPWGRLAGGLGHVHARIPSAGAFPAAPL